MSTTRAASQAARVHPKGLFARFDDVRFTRQTNPTARSQAMRPSLRVPDTGVPIEPGEALPLTLLQRREQLESRRVASIQPLLSVVLDPPAKVEHREVLQRIEEQRRQKAPREPAQWIAWGDQVLVDVLGRHDEKIAPFTAVADAWMHVERDPTRPGFFEAMIGRDIPCELDVVVPWRGLSVTFHIRVKDARRPAVMRPPQAPDLNAVRNQLERERLIAKAREARRIALQRLARHFSIRVTEDQIDELIAETWRKGEGAALLRLGAKKDERDFSLRAHLSSPELRENARRELESRQVLLAVAQEAGVRVDEQTVQRHVDAVKRALEISGDVLARWKAGGQTARAIETEVMVLEGEHHLRKRLRVKLQSIRRAGLFQLLR